jgi:hypothetical protein
VTWAAAINAIPRLFVDGVGRTRWFTTGAPSSEQAAGDAVHDEAPGAAHADSVPAVTGSVATGPVPVPVSGLDQRCGRVQDTASSGVDQLARREGA